MKFYQACYGKPDNASWALYNTSDDMIANMATFYEKAESRNTPQYLNSNDMVDENGNALCFTEVISQMGIVSVSKIQYGTKDNAGRAKMTAHGFLFSIEDDPLSDPNDILAIADSNFKFDVEASKTIPEKLEYDQKYDIRGALKACGMDFDCLTKFISCLYLSFTSTTDFPIYVYSSRANEIMRPLMYCVYKLIPEPLRYNISFSNANNMSKVQFKSIMFVNKHYDDVSYFDADTGDTNIDISEIETLKENYPFLNKLKELGIDGFDAYCKSLQLELDNMQMSVTSDYDILKLADIFAKGDSFVKSMNAEALTRFLLEITVYAPIQNRYIDDRLSEYLTEFYGRGISPNEALMHRVQVRSEKTSSSNFVEIYKQLKMKSLADQGDNAVVDFLAEQHSIDQERFENWRQYILKLPGGVSIVEKYYVQALGNTRSYEELVAIYSEAPKETRRDAFKQATDDQCLAILRMTLREQEAIIGSFTTVLDRYKGILNILHPDDRDMFYQIFEAECLQYWKTFNLNKFEFTEARISNFRCLEVDRSPMYRFIKILIDVYDTLEGNVKCTYSLVEYAEKVIQSLIQNDYLTTPQWKSLAPKIQTYFLAKLEAYKASNFWFWYALANFKSETNPYVTMLNWELEVLVDEAAFSRSVRFENLTPKHIDKLIDDLEGDDEYFGYIDNGDFDKSSDEYKLLKKRLNILHDISKGIEKQARAEAKAEESQRLKALKEEKEREKLAKKEQQKESQAPIPPTKNKPHSHTVSDKTPEKKGFFSNIFGGNSKRK